MNYLLWFLITVVTIRLFNKLGELWDALIERIRR